MFRYKPLFSLIAITVAVLPLFSLTIGGSWPATASTELPLDGAFVPNEILIGLRPEAIQQVNIQRLTDNQLGLTSLDHLNRRYSVRQVVPIFKNLRADDFRASQAGLAGLYKLVVPPGTDIFAMIADYRQDLAVAFAEPNRIYRAMWTPNDPEFNAQWGLHNIGQTGGTPDADIDAPEAWNLQRGNASVLIAIVDTGVDYNHPDLVGGRVRTDIDHDFANGDEDAMDDHGHGTYVAGIVGANTDNGVGIAGICHGCQLLPVKVLNADGEGTAEWVAQGIQYAAQSGARIISMSLGFASDCGCSQTVAQTINYAFESGSLLIAASGNDSDKNRTSYPASSPRVMAVGAADYRDQEADFSNRDSYLDIYAPGVDVRSLAPNGGYQTADGTSAATPFVSGVAGLVWSQNRNLTNTQVWWILYQSAEDAVASTNAVTPSEDTTEMTASDVGPQLIFRIFLPSMSKMRSSAGHLNAYRALTFPTSEAKTFAPVDACNGEPQCSPGCGAEVSLAGSVTGGQDLALLRVFRDKVLNTSAVGHAWVEIYERNRLEVASRLAANADLRAQARITVQLSLPLIEALINPDGTGKAVITSAHIEAVEKLLMALENEANPILRADLGAARAVLELGRQYVGRDVREFWSALQQAGD